MKPLLIILLAACTVFGQSRARGGVGRSFGSSPRGATQSARPPLLPHPQHGVTAVVPYPVFYGGYYYYDPSLAGGGYPPPAPGYYDDPNGPAPSQGPVVIMNQAYRPDMVGNQVTRDYSDAPLPQAYDTGDQQATIYLIALKDQTILSAIAYWAEGDMLTYITPESTQNRISLSLVDRDFSKTLNDDRHVEFKLPKP